jgi:hypothetical protein
MFKGTRNNNGRERGKPNLITAKVRESFNELLEGNLDKIQSDLDSLKPIERVRVLLEMASFVIPKMKSIEVNDLTERQVVQPLIVNFENFGSRDKQLR